jgi:hypothetical protein
MKNTVIVIALLLAAFSVTKGQPGPEITSWILNTTNATGYNGIPSNVQTVQYSASQVYVSASCIPGYNIGPWTANPNTPTNQNFVCKFTRTPVQNTGTPVFTGLGNTGLWSNGVAIFNPKDGQYWSGSAFTMGATTTGFNRNALVYEGASFDNCLGHPAPGGVYHNHVNPGCLYNSTLTTAHSPIIGYAFDGFPVYGAYAYTNTNGTGAIKRMTPSFVLAASTGSVLLGANTASASATPATPTTRNGGPPVNATYPLGNMLEDYIYVAGSGDLDFHNGRFCVTPEYPLGTYAYFVTIDATGYPVYPFVLGPTYYGTVQAGNTGPGGSHVTISEATTVYTPGIGTNIQTAGNPEIKFTVEPNPTQAYLFIYMDVSSANNVKGSLVDAKGKTVRTIDFLQPSIAYSLDMTDLSNGMYFLIFETGSQKTTHKIIKSN